MDVPTGSTVRFGDRADSQSVSETVLQAVASVEGVEAHELDPSLYSAVDPDALESLFADEERASASSLSVGFEYHGYWVHIDGDGAVTVTEIPSDGTATTQTRSER